MDRPKGASAAGLPSLMEYNPSVTLLPFKYADELMLDPMWGDGASKGRRCLMLFIDECYVRLLFKLDNDALKTSCVAASLDEVLATFDQLVSSGKLVWEQDEARHQKGKKKSA